MSLLRDPNLPPGWPFLLGCAAVIYLPPLVFEAVARLVDLVRVGDDAIADLEGDD